MAEPALVAYGSSPYEKREGHDLIWHLSTAAADCLDRAGIDHDRVDGLALTAFGYPPGNAVTLAEHFGMRLTWAQQGIFGGASGVIAVGHAAEAVRQGRARVVLCLAGDAFTVASHDRLLDEFSPAIRDHLAPHGFGGANGIFALVQSRHSHLYGTRRDQLGSIAVTQREHALRNDNALFKEPLTLDHYLGARPIAEPLHLFDCVMPCSGAEAVLLVDADLAAETGRPPVAVRSFGEVHNADPESSSSITGGWDQFADRIFAEAGASRDDVDFVQLYDDYPIMVALQFEQYGFCSKGEGGPFVDQTDLSIQGELPLNTGGGQLSCGQCGAGGGMIGLTEAVRQLQHEGKGRQVKGATLGLVSGFGLISYGKGLSTSGMLLAANAAAT